MVCLYKLILNSTFALIILLSYIKHTNVALMWSVILCKSCHRHAYTYICIYMYTQI